MSLLLLFLAQPKIGPAPIPAVPRMSVRAPAVPANSVVITTNPHGPTNGVKGTGVHATPRLASGDARLLRHPDAAAAIPQPSAAPATYGFPFLLPLRAPSAPAAGPPVPRYDAPAIAAAVVDSDPPTVWEVQTASSMRLKWTKVDDGVFPTYCDINDHSIGTPGSVHVWHVNQEYYQQPIRVNLDPQDGGMLFAKKEACARCSDPIADPAWFEKPFDCLPVTFVTETVTKFEWEKSIKRLLSTKYFATDTIHAACPLPDPEATPPVSGNPNIPFGDTICYYEAWAHYLHIGPLCTNATCLTADVGLDRRHIVVCINGSTDVVVSLQDHALTEFYQGALGFQASWAHVKIDRQSSPQVIRLWTVESAKVYVRTSTDGGKTFGAGVLIANSGGFVTADIGLNRISYVYWRDGTQIKGQRFDAALTALEAVFVCSGADVVDAVDPCATVFPIAGGKNRVVLRYTVGGLQVTKTSFDGITFV